MEGRDILARARTGSGKTGAFAIPVIQNILNLKQVSALILRVDGLILQIHSLLVLCFNSDGPTTRNKSSDDGTKQGIVQTNIQKCNGMYIASTCHIKFSREIFFTPGNLYAGAISSPIL